MYWWDKAARLTRAGDLRRFGLITTNSITQTFNRKIVSEHVDAATKPLGIAFAIPDHPWVESAEGAAVRVAMTTGTTAATEGRLIEVVEECGTEEDATSLLRDKAFGRITADLDSGTSAAASECVPLTANKDLCFQGCKLAGKGFLIDGPTREKLLRDNSNAAGFVRILVAGSDITKTPERRYVVDLFGLSEDEARRNFAAGLQIAHDRVKPERDQNKRESYRLNWWIFAEPRPKMRRACEGLGRFIGTSEVAKHRVFVFFDLPECLADGSLAAIATDDGYVLGVLSSRAHVKWSLTTGGRMGIGNDPRYQNGPCFLPFPFPAATDTQQQKIRELGEALDAHRKAQQAAHPGLTITGMYNVLEKLRSGEPLTAKEKKIHDDGLVSVLKKIHDDLDAVVFDAYGWPVTLSDDEILERLVALNHERAEEEKRGLVRWLRPEFQNKGGGGDVQLAIDADDTDDDAADAEEPAAKPAKRGRGAKAATPAAEPAGRKKPAKAAKQPWPKDLAEQTRAVRGVVAAAGEVVTAADVARAFKHAKAPRVEEILDTLVALGHARRTDSGYAPA